MIAQKPRKSGPHRQQAATGRPCYATSSFQPRETSSPRDTITSRKIRGKGGHYDNGTTGGRSPTDLLRLSKKARTSRCWDLRTTEQPRTIQGRYASKVCWVRLLVLMLVATAAGRRRRRTVEEASVLTNLTPTKYIIQPTRRGVDGAQHEKDLLQRMGGWTCRIAVIESNWQPANDAHLPTSHRSRK